ncbi:hypothetical protein [Paraburkholderia acidisoli]|uniref:Uncharacterized protein n=1 Tax=Paraburkholderia acidisoli TaxID=2571748 RepID=A0A7Z2JJN8_9BURK|nr:hypothetical protein [Paraburkholderia acidisoli]QGZ66981.1 hypothetical protein FAZ98_34670 [Paraburkholderia acidisoli]
MQRQALVLGARLKMLIDAITSAHIRFARDDPRNRRIATKYAYDYVREIFNFSHSKIRLYVHAYEKFHQNDDAVMYLRMTDMQLLLSHEIGDDIVNAVIQRRKENPRLSTREVKALIIGMRPQPLVGRDGSSPSVGAQA